ncbi:MAG: hypothetical protein ACOC3T_04955 [Bacteroidota bacterium]
MLWEQATYYSCAGKTGITSKIGGGFAHVEPLDYELEQLENIHGERPFDNYEEFSDALAEMQYRSFDCVNLDPDKVETDGPLEVIHELDHEDEEEDQLYFYHPDHLGSSSFITDADGEPYQFLQYLPFGESFISQRLDEWQARYTFSAKEKD